MLDNHISVNKQCQYEAYKDDKSYFVLKDILFAKLIQAHVAFGRGDLPSPLMAIFEWTNLGYSAPESP